MPALPSVPKVLELAFQTLESHTSHVDVNRIHLAYTGTAPTSGELASFATTALTAFGSALAPSTTTDKTFSGLVAIDLSTPTSATAEVAGSTPGTLAGTELPDSIAFVMSATVARRYRGGHPRSYLPLGDVEHTSFGREWTTGFVTSVQTAWAGFITALEGAGWTGAGTLSPVNVSYYHGSLPITYPGGRVHNIPQLRVGGPLVDAITGYIGRTKLGTQRRRLGA